MQKTKPLEESVSEEEIKPQAVYVTYDMYKEHYIPMRDQGAEHEDGGVYIVVSQEWYYRMVGR